MPTAPVDVDPDTYLSAGDAFLAVNDAVCDLVAAAATAAGSGSGMAGTDSGGVDWAAGLDRLRVAAVIPLSRHGVESASVMPRRGGRPAFT